MQNVKLRGVVLASDPQGNTFHVHDGTGTRRVSVPRGTSMVLPEPGREVQLEGSTASYRVAGSLHIRLNANKIESGATVSYPKGEAISLATLNTFSHVDQWVSVEGFVMEWSFHRPFLYVKLIDREAWSTVVIRLPDGAQLPKSIHSACVRVTGVDEFFQGGEVADRGRRSRGVFRSEIRDLPFNWVGLAVMGCMDTQHANAPNGDPAPELDHPDYPQWLCRQVGADLKRRRVALGKTAMGMAGERRDSLSDQTILNNEGGEKNPGFVTLSRHCQMLGTSFPEMMETAVPKR